MAYQNIFVDSTNEPHTVYVWDDRQGLINLPLSDFRYAYTKDPRGKYLSMTGERLSKTRRFSRGHPSLFESDLPIETRVLTDLYLHEDTPSENNITLFFDIEVSMEMGIPNTKQANNPITSIAAYNPLEEKYTVLVVDANQLYTNKETPEVDTIFCSTETELLHKFIELYEYIKPTIITGWNSNGFDVPYLYNRIRQICGPSTANRLSPIGKVKYSDRLERYKIAGISSLDYLELYRKFTYTQQINYRLDTIGRAEVNMGKVDYDGSLDILFRDNLEKFIEYNLQDVRIIVELDKKLKLIELVRGICHIGHISYEDFSMSSRFLEGTIVTYLHRKGIIVTDKPQVESKDIDNDDDDDEGFSGAFVRPPMPGLYEWVYSLDLQSLYPSILMSLNISPETKVGFVRNWNAEQHLRKEIVAYVVEEVGNTTSLEMKYDAFVEFMKENNLSISSNGVLYNNTKKGIIPEVLENWFAQRKEYKNLMIKYGNEGDKEKESYYDQRQHIQKIFLNSLYGVLGLSVFRFYDIDNALAVTASGQDVIKNSATFVNNLYTSRNVAPKSKAWLDKYWQVLKLDAKKRKVAIPPYPLEDDHCVYIDTDSLYFSSDVFLTKYTTDDEKINFTVKLAKAVESKLNKYYDELAEQYFFCVNHKFHIKGESIASTGFWVIKKRYALDKVYDLEKDKPVAKLVVKGLDVVRSSFPKAFREFMTQLLKDVLRKAPKDMIDANILEFKESLKNRDYLDIARNTSANNISEFVMNDVVGLKAAKKGTPAHIKAAITYNRLLTYYNLNGKFDSIRDGEKIKYVYLAKNPLQIETVAVKGYQDPPQIIEYIKTHIDTDALFDNELRNKLEDFYTALKWGNIPTEVNQNANEFFSF
jgi:DNA polymerase elongation subunit (family B)